MSKINVAVLFGGISPEHEVSIISGIQVLNALNESKYNVIPVYVTKTGRWVKGDKSFFDVAAFKDLGKYEKVKCCFISPDRTLDHFVSESGGFSFFKSIDEKIDVVFPVFHGGSGENGGIQGLLELSGLAYVGNGVAASSVAMDKMIAKRVAQAIGVPVLAGNWVTKESLKNAMDGLKFPVYVKPVHLGSSIAVTRASNKKELEDALEVGFFYDDKVLVEQGLDGAKEVNVSLLGNNPYEISPTEMPHATSKVLSFKDKYLSGGSKSAGMASLSRIVPAPVKKETEKKIVEYATDFFAEIGGEGICRIDFLVSNDERKIYLNEINPMPGSLSFYLWKEKGMSFTKLLDKLIELGVERKEKKDKLNTTFESNILEGFNGAKGSKF